MILDPLTVASFLAAPPPQLIDISVVKLQNFEVLVVRQSNRAKGRHSH